MTPQQSVWSEPLLKCSNLRRFATAMASVRLKTFSFRSLLRPSLRAHPVQFWLKQNQRNVAGNELGG